MQNIRPIGDKILIRQVPPVEYSPSGIYVGRKAREWPPSGEVIAIGPGRIDEHGARAPMSVAVGDQVIFTRRSSTEVESLSSDAERFLMLCDADIDAIVEK